VRKIILLLGGARSGKSQFAQELAHKAAGEVLFVATATAEDEDMRLRILKHRSERPASWRTLEVPFNIGLAIKQGMGETELVVIDCITLLINNIFCKFDLSQFETIEESVLGDQVAEEIQELVKCIETTPGSYIIVSNEVGLGLVPDNRMGRLYRDFLGRANQTLARCADEVYLMVAGIPLRVKP